MIDSSGSTLGAVPAILTTKLLTADKQVYFSDGTNWRPFYGPGWIRYDGASDQEWEGANADPPSGWTYDNQSTAVSNVGTTTPSCLRMTCATAPSGRGAYLYQSAPASPSGKTYYAHMSFLNAGAAAFYTGIFIRNSSNGRLLCLITKDEGSGIQFYVQRNTTSSVFSANAYNASTTFLGQNSSIVLAMTNDGTNAIFKYAPFYGGQQTSWVTIYSEAIATFIGAWDQVGYTIQGAGTIESDWFRIQAL